MPSVIITGTDGNDVITPLVTVPGQPKASAADDIISGGLGDDRLDGAGGADSLYGGDGNDYLTGGKGADILDGGAGDDYLIGGDGNDRLIGGEGIDTASYETANFASVVDLRFQPDFGFDGGQRTSGAGFDYLSGIENVVGSVFADFLIGSSAANEMFGGNGNDAIASLDGDDRLGGGNGHDTLFGDAGDDALSGGQGDDLLSGGLGRDVLIGGAGRDLFLFDVLETSLNKDVIKSFEKGEDRLMIDTSVFAALRSAAGSADLSWFVNGTKAVTADQHIIYNAAKGALYYDADGSGAGAMVQIASLTNHPDLDASDFLFIGPVETVVATSSGTQAGDIVLL